MLTLGVNHHTVSGRERTAVCIELNINKIVAAGARVVTVQKNLGLLNAPFDKSVNNTISAVADNAEGIGNLLIGKNLAV